jgi:hypothetical protein
MSFRKRITIGFGQQSKSLRFEQTLASGVNNAQVSETNHGHWAEKDR